MSGRAFLSLAATALALGACNGGGVVSYQDPANSADVGEIRAALNGRVTAVSVVSNPFPGISDMQLAQAVAADIPTGFLSSGRFTGDPTQATHTDYRIVWDFGASGAYGASDGGCGSPILVGGPTPAPVAPRATDVHGSISLCRGTGPLTRAYGYVDQVSGPGDGKFRSFVSLMAQEILLYPMPAGGSGGGPSKP